MFYISGIYRLGNTIHRLLYTVKIKKRVKTKTCLISIGNITAGGNGKTPFLMMLLHDLHLKHVAVICRLFRSTLDDIAFATVDKQDARFGDEPRLIATVFPSYDVFVGKSKSDVAMQIDNQHFNMIVIDDGFQHYRLIKDYNIVMIGADHDFEQYYLPVGVLRETPKHLKEADLIVIHQAHNKLFFEEMHKKIRKYTKADIIGTIMTLDRGAVELIQGKQVALFCAIASPGSFIQLVEGYATIVYYQLLPDHSMLDQDALVEFAKKSKERGASCLVCTEKDFIKLSSTTILGIPIYCMKATMQVVYHIEIYQQLLSKLKQMAKV
ncbi:MAG: tetraacyldisaccharide 4'-kinase [Chlamydiales bacterium]|nr:tetraacyldisaccharide 4'-kinase [Chlamydiales bacterium]